MDKTAAGIVNRVSMIALNFRAARTAAGRFTSVLETTIHRNKGEGGKKKQ